ncbi:hypothetical protein JYT11_00440 [Planctomycetaceae bacterium AH-315-I19]|nr:hypothetical protein [Planctomycetaceae bacterium AH-315-I19]
MQLLVSGAIQGGDGNQGVLAVLLILDGLTGDILYRSEYTPPDELVSEGQKIQFTGSCFIDGVYYVCSHNEILVYEDWPPDKPVRRITINGFNDLHHCLPYKGGLAVSNTGLETVDHVSLDGELIERWDLLKGIDGARTIDPGTDYRLIADTKPHLRHGNHLFLLDGKLWSSQLSTSDAACVCDTTQRLEMEVGMPHDGIVMGDKIVFTTTNGHLVFFDVNAPHAREAIHLTQLNPDFAQLGWCRGVCEVPPGGGRVGRVFRDVQRPAPEQVERLRVLDQVQARDAEKPPGPI